MLLTQHCNNHFSAEILETYPSRRLLTDVQYYENHFLGSRNKFAVMLQLERMTLQLNIKKHRGDNSPDAEKCLTEAIEAAEQIWSKDIKPIVAMDVGKYGSGSWYKSVDVMKLEQQANSTLPIFVVSSGHLNSGRIHI